MQVIHEVGGDRLSQLPQALSEPQPGLRRSLLQLLLLLLLQLQLLLLLHLQGLGLLGLSGHLPGTLKGLEVVDGVFVIATPDAVHHLAVVAHRLIQLCTGVHSGARFRVSAALSLPLGLHHLHRVWEGCHVSCTYGAWTNNLKVAFLGFGWVTRSTVDNITQVVNAH